MKTLTTLLALTLTLGAISQERLSLQLSANTFLGTSETFMSAKAVMQGNQQEWGYMIIYPEFQYIDQDLKRYSANIGYVLNRLFINGLSYSAAIGYGIVDNQNFTSKGLNFTTGLGYRITNGVNLVGSFSMTRFHRYENRNVIKAYEPNMNLGVDIDLL